MNGEPLPVDHGYPVRLLVPGRYGMKNPKWITSLDFVDVPYTGYSEQRGWSNDASYQTNALVHDPFTWDSVPAGEIVVSGTAFAGSDPIVSVELSVDGGAWAPAVLDYAPGPDIWTLWHFEVTLAEGNHTVQARCTTASGATSGPESRGTNYLSGFGGSGEVQFDVV
jgi:hypothetical protein